MKVLILFLTLLVSSAVAQDNASTKESKLTRAVVDILAPIHLEDAPGGVVCVIRDGKAIVLESFGSADIERKTPVSKSTPFYIASTAKTITAYCVMHAAGAGKLDLDAPLHKYFPRLPKSLKGATLRHAMHHTSGLVDVYDTVIGADLPREVMSSNERVVELMASIPEPNFSPGTSFLYSNSGYVLLAQALQQATGESLAQYARKHVFEPFGMPHAHYLGENHKGAVAKSYSRTSEGWSSREVITGLTGPGGLYASMQDLIQFDLGIRNGVDSKLKASLFKTAPHASHPNLGSYGAGWMLQEFRGLQVQRHQGGAFGFNADLLRFPDQDTTIIVLLNTNAISATDLSEELAELVLAKEIEDSVVAPLKTIPFVRADVQRFGRIWQSTETGFVWVITPKAEAFAFASLGDVKVKLVKVGETRLEALDPQAPFAVELDGESLLVMRGSDKPLRLKRLAFPPSGLEPSTDYAGEYGSDDLNCQIRLVATDDGRLRLQQQEDPLLEIPPFLALGPDLYICDKGAQMNFHRNDSGEIIGLTMHVNRAWGLEFKRLK